VALLFFPFVLNPSRYHLGLIPLTSIPKRLQKFFATLTIMPSARTPSETPSIKLNNGYEMPQVGFGLWKVDNATCADTVYNAIKTGYRLFDGACG
jgi:hypothetical protein